LHRYVEAFMTRSSAEKAKEEMDGKVLHRHDIRVGWGKSVTLPPKPIWPLADDNDEDNEDNEDNEDYRRRVDNRRGGDRGGANTNNVQGVAPPAPDPAPGVPEVLVTFPEDPRLMALIDTLARYVAEDGQGCV
jgi:U2-associated protein SR140